MKSPKIPATPPPAPPIATVTGAEASYAGADARREAAKRRGVASTIAGSASARPALATGGAPGAGVSQTLGGGN
jgi:hypothetical protein